MAKGPAIRGANQSSSPSAPRRPTTTGSGQGPAPWLDEAAYSDDSSIHTLIGRRALFGLLVVAGLLTIGIVTGILLVSRRESSPIDIPAVGEAVPVLSSDGPWKVAPDGPGTDGIPVEGQGQTLYGTGNGQPTDASIALDALPEDPLPKPGGANAGEETEVIQLPSPATQAPTTPPITATTKAPALPQTPPKAASMPKVLEAVEQARTAAAPTAPAAPPAAASTPSAGGQTLQLGAFSTEARARAAFSQLTGRFSYLQGLEPRILPVASEGRTLYRLRTVASSSSAAKDICARLKVAGEACSVID